MSDHSKHYSESSFWEKISAILKTAGRALIEKALWLFFAAQRPETPAWAKAVIYGALGYLILPVDAVPDLLPGGLLDDGAALVAAVGMVALYIDDGVKRQAEQKLRDLGL